MAHRIPEGRSLMESIFIPPMLPSTSAIPQRSSKIIKGWIHLIRNH